MRMPVPLLVAAAFAAATATPLWAVSAAEQTATVDATAAGPATGQAQHADASTPAHESDWKAMDEAMAERAAAFPAETAGRGAPALEPEVLADGTKQFTLTTALTDWEIEPGKVVQVMSYNGTVPGPTLRADVGDRVRVVLRNELPESTVIHWHGIPVTNGMDGVADITQPPVPPGGSFTYELTAERTSVGWYHSHHNGTKQVGDGLWGAFLIGSLALPDGATPAQELTLQLQDSGAVGLTLNGKSFPATEPIRAARGERVLLHYVNAGGQAHPMHLHGLDQLVVAKDGFPLAQPYLADTVEVAPGERYSVLVTADRPGAWGFHCHIFSHSEGSEGMFGMFTEFVVA